MKSLEHSVVLLVSVMACLLPAVAQVRTYQVISANVPFKFTAGERVFRPGHYEFILVGPGLMAIRDQHRHMVASLITRTSDEASPSARTRLVFDRSKKKARLQKIYVESRTQVLEVVGEQLAIQSSPPPETSLPWGATSFSRRAVGVPLSH